MVGRRRPQRGLIRRAHLIGVERGQISRPILGWRESRAIAAPVPPQCASPAAIDAP